MKHLRIYENKEIPLSINMSTLIFDIKTDKSEYYVWYSISERKVTTATDNMKKSSESLCGWEKCDELTKLCNDNFSDYINLITKKAEQWEYSQTKYNL